MTDHPIPNSYWVATGQILAGHYPGAGLESTARRKLTALLDAGIRSFVDLTQTHDNLVPYDTLVRTLARERGHDVAYRRMAIRDLDVPTPEHMEAVLAHIDAEITDGRAVYVHCWGGIGRTGTVVGCWMVEKESRAARAALDRIAHLRQGTPDVFTRSPETDEQRAFVERWERR